MTNEIAVRQPQAGVPALQMDEDELLSVLESSLYPGAQRASIKLVVGWCRAAGKDPMKRPVHIVPMSVKKAGTRDQYEWRDVIMPGINDYRIDAARTGQHAGNGEAVFGPDVTRNLGGVEITFPEWCEFTVFRLVGADARSFSSGRVRFLETYATVKRDSAAPNAMWRKRPYGQLEKCAEALALRRAFPEVGASPTAEEMEGRVIEHEIDGAVVDGGESAGGGVKQPRRKSAGAKPGVTPADAKAAADVAERELDRMVDQTVSDAEIVGETKKKPAVDDDGELCGAGERAYLKKKAGDALAQILQEVGAASLESLTARQFMAARQIVLGRE